LQTIQNTSLRIRIQDKGAELCSIVSLKNGKEYMWSADPAIWGSYSPVLFPIIGALKNGEYFYKNKRYSVPKHGFIRNNENLIFKQISNSCVEYSLKYDEESLKNYPFKFEFIIRFKLIDNSILIEHEVINHSAEDDMFFSLGGHPAFKCPFNENEVYEDYYLEFEKIENCHTWEVLSTGLINSTTRPLLENTNQLNLHKHLFDNDALIIKEHNSKKVSLKSRKSNDSITIEYKDFPYLGIWAKPGADFVCIEPWLGISDSHDTDQNFKTKEGIVSLNSNSNFKAYYIISIY
jgi:galactose mutarotase-like enzyme